MIRLTTIVIEALRALFAGLLVIAPAMGLLGCEGSGKGVSDMVVSSLPELSESPDSSNDRALSVDVAAKRGALSFKPVLTDLGKHPWHSEVPFYVEFHNSTDATVTVSGISMSCTCTVLNKDSYAGTAIGPGESLSLKGTIRTGYKVGEFSREIAVILDSGQTYSADLRLTVFPTYTLDPSIIRFGTVDLTDERSPVSRSARFASDTVFLTGAPTTDSPWLQVGLDDRGNGETEIRLYIVKRALPYGRHLARVSIPLDDPNQPQLTLMATAEGVLPLRPLPAHVFLRGELPATVRFVERDGSPARLVNAVIDDAALSLSIETGDSVVVTNPKHRRFENALAVWVTDEDGRKARFLVTTVE